VGVCKTNDLIILTTIDNIVTVTSLDQARIYNSLRLSSRFDCWQFA